MSSKSRSETRSSDLTNDSQLKATLNLQNLPQNFSEQSRVKQTNKFDKGIRPATLSFCDRGRTLNRILQNLRTSVLCCSVHVFSRPCVMLNL